MVVYYHCSSTPNFRMPNMLPIYLPTRSGNTDDFKEALDLLDVTLSLYRLNNDVYILGEFNADLVTEGGLRACSPVNEQGRILLRYLSRWKYLLYNLHLSPSQSWCRWNSIFSHREYQTQKGLQIYLSLRNNLSSVKIESDIYITNGGAT